MTASIIPASPSSLSCNALPITALASYSSEPNAQATPGTSELTSLSPFATLPITFTGTLPASAIGRPSASAFIKYAGLVETTPNTSTSACDSVCVIFR